MLTEQFVSFETAKLLKEKGFPQDPAICNMAYKINGKLSNNAKSFWPNSSSIIPSRCYTIAPTQQMARQWLDETYDVRIFILPARDTDNYMCHVYVVWKINKSSGDFEEVYMSNFYEDYDECMEGAIDYCVESLV